MGFGAFYPRQIRLPQRNLVVAVVADRGCRSHPPSLKLRRTRRPRLQIGALQKNCADMFHLVKRASDVARLQLDSAAAVYDHTRIEPELARVDRAVFHAVIQREPHQVNVFDSALL